MPDGSPQALSFQACVRAPFATLGISATDTHVTGIRFLHSTVAGRAPKRNTIAFLACVQLQAYLDDPRFEFDLPLKLAGTHHRLAVWEAMQRIPAGRNVRFRFTRRAQRPATVEVFQSSAGRRVPPRGGQSRPRRKRKRTTSRSRRKPPLQSRRGSCAG